MRVAIVEDDPSSARQIQMFLEKFGKESSVQISCAVYGDGQDFLSHYQSQWDLILFDIEMPVMDGLSAAREIRKKDPSVLIIFITQMAQYAIHGYEVSALDYILKPLNYYSFSIKMKRVLRILAKYEPGFLAFQSGGIWKKMSLDAIFYIEVFNHTILYHTQEGDYSSTGTKTIRQLETELSGSGFARCNQSYLVNLRHVESLEQNTMILHGGSALRVSRNRRKTFMQALLTYWGG